MHSYMNTQLLDLASQVFWCFHYSISLLLVIQPHLQVFHTPDLARKETKHLTRASHNTVISSSTLTGDGTSHCTTQTGPDGQELVYLEHLQNIHKGSLFASSPQ